MDPTDSLPMAVVIVGTVASFILALSPIPLVYRVIKSKELGFYRPDSFIVGAIFGIANGTYSMVSGQLISFISTMITCTLYCVYLGILIHFSKEAKRTILRKLLIAVCLAGFLTGIGPGIFRIVDSSDSGHSWFDARGGVGIYITTWLGVCATISIALLLSGQVPAMIKVFKSKDARQISTSMMLGGLFASITWCVYASLILDPYFMVSNGLGVVSGLLLVALKLKYRTPTVLTAEEEPHSISSVKETIPGSP